MLRVFQCHLYNKAFRKTNPVELLDHFHEMAIFMDVLDLTEGIADFPPNWTAGSSSISAKMGIKLRDCIKSCWYLQCTYSMTYDEQVRGTHIHDFTQSRTFISVP